jgi:hypothetical protein
VLGWRKHGRNTYKVVERRKERERKKERRKERERQRELGKRGFIVRQFGQIARAELE